MRCVAMLVVAGVVASRTVVAQSTASLRHPEPRWSVRGAVGVETRYDAYGNQTGPMRAASVSVRRRSEGAVIHFDGWFIQRTPDGSQGTLYAPGGRLERTRLLAFTVGGAVPLRLDRNISIEPSIGIGVVPFARGTFGPFETSPNEGLRVSRDAFGMVVPLSLSVHVWRFSIEQHVMSIFGADKALYNGEYAPLMFGLQLYPW